MIKWLKKRKSRSKKNFDLHKRGVAAFFILARLLPPIFYAKIIPGLLPGGLSRFESNASHDIKL